MPEDDRVPLGGVMIDAETVRTRDGKKGFDNRLQVVESSTGERTGTYRRGHEQTSKLRDLKLKDIHLIRKPDGTTKEVAEYVPE